MEKNKKNMVKIDYFITVVPLIIVIIVACYLTFFPNFSTKIIVPMKKVLVDDLGFVYILFGLLSFFLSIWLAFSRYGNVKLGSIKEPKYSNFAWGAMIFNSTMAADILYWSMIEWAYYYNDNPFGIKGNSLMLKQELASAYPLFHWGAIPWSFYILPATAYGYMLFVGGAKQQRISEACRPLLGNIIAGTYGKIIDVFAIVALLAGTATTFSLATPLLSACVAHIAKVPNTASLTILLLLFTAIIFTLAVLSGMGGISKLARGCTFGFCLLLFLFFILGPKIFIIESGITAIGIVMQNFFKMATWMDPLRLSGKNGTTFTQNWTIFYWAYWIAWSVATPFFIGRISEGRTIKQTILGAYLSGLTATFLSFIVFGNYGLYLQTANKVDVAGILSSGVEPSDVILRIIKTMPFPSLIMLLLSIVMIAFYATTFDAITMVISEYSLKSFDGKSEAPKYIKIYWCFVFIALPIALIMTKVPLHLLQTISICAAFPMLIITLIIILGFLKDLKKGELP